MEKKTALQVLETEARSTGSVKFVVEGQEFEIARKGKLCSTRVSYRHGKRNMGRDEAEAVLKRVGEVAWINGVPVGYSNA